MPARRRRAVERPWLLLRALKMSREETAPISMAERARVSREDSRRDLRGGKGGGEEECEAQGLEGGVRSTKAVKWGPRFQSGRRR